MPVPKPLTHIIGQHEPACIIDTEEAMQSIVHQLWNNQRHIHKNKQKLYALNIRQTGKSSTCCPLGAAPVYSSLWVSSAYESPSVMCTVCMCSASDRASASPWDLSATQHSISPGFISNTAQQEDWMERHKSLKTSSSAIAERPRCTVH